jgi:hypothetical protein
MSENDKQKPGRGRTQIIKKKSKQKHGVMKTLIHAQQMHYVYFAGKDQEV